MTRPLRTKPLFTPPKARQWKWLPVVLLIGGALFLAGVGLQFYSQHSLPNISLAGRDASHQTKDQLRQLALQQFKNVRFQLQNGFDVIKAAPDDLGISVDAESSANRAFALRRNVLNAVQMWQPAQAPLTLQFDISKARAFLQKTFGADFAEPVDADLHYDEVLQEFKVIGGKTGKGIDISQLSAAVKSQAHQPRLMIIQAQPQVQPERTTLTIGTNCDEANQLLRSRIVFIYRQKVMYLAEPSDIAKWLYFVPANQPGKLSIAYDKQKVADFLRHTVTHNLNHFYGPEGELNQPEMLPAPAKQLQLLAVDDLVNDIIDALSRKSDLEKELQVTTES